MTIRELIEALQESERAIGGDAPVTVWVSPSVCEDPPAERPVEDVATCQGPGEVGCMLVIEYHWPNYQDRKGTTDGNSQERKRSA